jgi:hypothetical protein
MPSKNRQSLDDRSNVNKLVYGLYILCGLLVPIQFLFEQHPHFAVEKFPGFYGIFGFVVFVAIVLAGKLLRRAIMREEDYYDR